MPTRPRLWLGGDHEARPLAVQSYMGHQHYSTTQRYLHHKPRREDAARLADAFGYQSGTNESGSEDKRAQERTAKDA